MVVPTVMIVIHGRSSNNSRSTYSHMSFSFQLPERAMFQIKQYNPATCGVSEWQLEEAQVFWAKKEQSLALSILKQMIKKLDASCAEVHFFLLAELIPVIKKLPRLKIFLDKSSLMEALELLVHEQEILKRNLEN